MRPGIVTGPPVRASPADRRRRGGAGFPRRPADRTPARRPRRRPPAGRPAGRAHRSVDRHGHGRSTTCRACSRRAPTRLEILAAYLGAPRRGLHGDRAAGAGRGGAAAGGPLRLGDPGALIARRTSAPGPRHVPPAPGLIRLGPADVRRDQVMSALPASRSPSRGRPPPRRTPCRSRSACPPARRAPSATGAARRDARRT